MNQVCEVSLDTLYEIKDSTHAFFTATCKEDGKFLRVYTINFNLVKRATSKDNIVKKLSIYRGLHLLPCMCPLYNMSLSDGVLLLEQFFTENGTLEDEVSSCVKYQVCISEESIKMWLAQIATALDSLHKRRVIHGGVQTSNLFFGKNKNFLFLGPTDEFLNLHVRPRALNHDISVFKTDRAELREKSAKFRDGNRAIEKMEYLAPELLNPVNDVNYSNDVWSLGVVAYKLATLHAPFQGCCPIEVTSAIEEKEVNLAELQTRGYSSNFVSLVKNMLVKDPFQRLTAQGILHYKFLPAKMHIRE